LEKGDNFDAVIVDSVSYEFEDYSPQPLFNKECLTHLCMLMTPGSALCMRLGSKKDEQRFQSLSRDAGFVSSRIMKYTPNGDLSFVPLGIAVHPNQ
jgi:hypothetical protein